MRAIGYGRVSSAGQVQGESPAFQRQQIEKFCKEKGWELVGIEEDLGVSGKKMSNRPGWQRVMQKAKNSEVEVVVGLKLTRIGRSIRDIVNAQHDLDECGVHLILIKEQFDTSTHFGRLAFHVMAAIAEFERETIREQMLDNKMSKWKDQRMFNGQPPFGYKWNKEKKCIDIVPDEAETYKQIVSLYVDQGLSMRDVCMRLKEQGNTKRKWSSQSLVAMFRNTIYYGKYIVNKHVYNDDNERGVVARTRKKKPADEWIEYTNVPALISKTRWDSIQEKTAFNKIKAKRSTYSKDCWLSNILVCARCGSKIIAHRGSDRKDGTFPRYYVCYESQASKKDLALKGKFTKCDLPFIPAEELENEVWADLLVRLHLHEHKHLDPLFDTSKMDARIKELEQLLSTLSKEIEKKFTAKERILELLEGDSFDRTLFFERLHKNDAEQETLKSRLETAEQELIEAREQRGTNLEIKEFLLQKKSAMNNLRREINHLKSEDRRVFIENMIDGRISVDYLVDPETGGKILDIRKKYKMNPQAFERLINDGKIMSLGKNSSLDPAPADT